MYTKKATYTLKLSYHHIISYNKATLTYFVFVSRNKSFWGVLNFSESLKMGFVHKFFLTLLLLWIFVQLGWTKMFKFEMKTFKAGSWIAKYSSQQAR